MRVNISEAMLDRPICAFDLETVPDADYGRRYLGMKGSDLDVQEAMQARRLEETANRTDFLPVDLHRIVTLSVAWWVPASGQLKVSTLGEGSGDESAAIQKFADKVLAQKPRLVSWNGNGFDLPVLHYRWLRHGIAAPHYWQPPSRYDAYSKRYSLLHVDLMDVLGAFRNPVKLDEAAQLCGFPGKVVTEGHRVFHHIARGELELVEGYCEMDALNTLLLFMRWCVTRGELDRAGELAFLRAVRDHLLSRPGRSGWEEVAKGLQPLLV